MKKATTLLFLFSLVFTLSAQTLSTFNEKKTYQNSENPRIELQKNHRQHFQQVNQQFRADLKTQTASIKLDSIIGEYADTAGTMPEKEFKYDFIYDANGNPITEYQSDWESNAWAYDSRIENTFNSNNQLTKEVYSDWEGGLWVLDWKYEYTWGMNGMISHETDYEWNGSQWEIAYKYDYAYDSNNNLIEEIEYDWNNGAWEQTDKYTYAYNANNQITQELDYGWDGSQWINDWKTDYTYDNNDFLILEENYTWNGTWFNSWKVEYTNDANGRPIEIIESSWMGNYWSINGKNELAYDANGNITESIYSSWYSGTFHPSQKEEFTFDLNYGPADMWLPLWFDEFYNKLVDATFYEYDNGNWELSQVINLYYTATPFGVEETSFNPIQLYPNPTKGLIYVKGNVGKETKVSVSDMTGKVVLTNPAYFNQMIDLSNLPSGIYFVKIIDGKKAIVKKVVKQ